MLFKIEEREEALYYYKLIGVLIFHVLINFEVKSLFEKSIEDIYTLQT